MTFKFLLHPYQSVIFRHTVPRILSSSLLGNFSSNYRYFSSLSIYAFIVVCGIYTYVCINAYTKCEPKKARCPVSGLTSCLALIRFMFTLGSAQATQPSTTAHCVTRCIGKLRSRFLLHTVHKIQYNRWMKNMLHGGVLEKWGNNKPKRSVEKDHSVCCLPLSVSCSSCRCFGFAWIGKANLEASKEIYISIKKKKKRR